MILPLVIVGNLFDRLVIVIRVLRQKSGILLVSDEKSEPHDEIDEDEDVVEGGQQVPGDGHAPQEVHGVGPQQHTAEEEDQGTSRLGALAKHQGPDVQEHREEGVAASLLLLQVLDDVLVTVLGGQVQRRLPVPVPGLELHRALGAEQLDSGQIAGDAGQVERTRPEIVRLLGIEAGVDQHLHEPREALVGGPVEGGVSVHVSQVGRGALAQQVGGGHAPPEHAGHHQRGQALHNSDLNPSGHKLFINMWGERNRSRQCLKILLSAYFLTNLCLV